MGVVAAARVDEAVVREALVRRGAQVEQLATDVALHQVVGELLPVDTGEMIIAEVEGGDTEMNDLVASKRSPESTSSTVMPWSEP